MTKIAQIQTILEVVADGDWGPISERALRNEILRSHAVESLLPGGSASHPFVQIAAKWMGRREITPNQFPGEDVVWDATSYPDGWIDRAPYCAAFVCYVVREAMNRGTRIGIPRPNSASVRELRAWARSHNLTIAKPQPGDFFTLLPAGISHIGLVESVDDGVIHTMEANTDGAGSRDGDGFWRKCRLISKCDFFRIPVLS